MKAFNVIAKVVAALAAIAGIVYVIATYGDKIVAWTKKMLKKPGCCCEDCECADCECNEDGECVCEADCEDCDCADCDCGDCEECCSEEPCEEVTEEEVVEANENEFEEA